MTSFWLVGDDVCVSVCFSVVEDWTSWRTSRLAQKYMPTSAHNLAMVRVSLAKLPKFLRRVASSAASWAAAVLATLAVGASPVGPAAARSPEEKMMAVLGGRVKARATSSRAERRRRDCDSEERTALERRDV